MQIDLTNYNLIDILEVKHTSDIISMNDIQVEDMETFILDSGILTHNSAIASFTEIRNPETQAGMPLKGKVMNVYGMPPMSAMENDEIADIVTAINLEFNEQMGDWILPDNVKLYTLEYESMFEIDKDGNSIIKKVIVSGSDRFYIHKKWITVDYIHEHFDKFRAYILSVVENNESSISDLSSPDYFHFRRLWDFRGFRKHGVKFEVKINKSSFICYDIDEIKVDGEFKKVSMFQKKDSKTKDVVEIKKVSQDTKLTRFHKLLHPAFDTKLNYSKIYIATDADPDGSSINNLLVNLFHEYFPELFWDLENPFINRIMFPMISATKGKQTRYYSNRPQFDMAKEKGVIDSSWKITYFKGLGSMEKEDWEHVFSNLDDYLFGIVDDGHLDQLMQIFFDDAASIRKEWLATY